MPLRDYLPSRNKLFSLFALFTAYLYFYYLPNTSIETDEWLEPNKQEPTQYPLALSAETKALAKQNTDELDLQFFLTMGSAFFNIYLAWQLALIMGQTNNAMLANQVDHDNGVIETIGLCPDGTQEIHATTPDSAPDKCNNEQICFGTEKMHMVFRRTHIGTNQQFILPHELRPFKITQQLGGKLCQGHQKLRRVSDPFNTTLSNLQLREYDKNFKEHPITTLFTNIWLTELNQPENSASISLLLFPLEKTQKTLVLALCPDGSQAAHFVKERNIYRPNSQADDTRKKLFFLGKHAMFVRTRAKQLKNGTVTLIDHDELGPYQPEISPPGHACYGHDVSFFGIKPTEDSLEMLAGFGHSKT